MVYDELGKKIREARGEASLREYAKKCNISHTHLDSIEKGYDPRTGKPVSITIETLEKLSNATGYSIMYLLGKSNEPYEIIKNEMDSILIELFTSLSFEKRQQVNSFLRYLIQEEDK